MPDRRPGSDMHGIGETEAAVDLDAGDARGALAAAALNTLPDDIVAVVFVAVPVGDEEGAYDIQAATRNLADEHVVPFLLTQVEAYVRRAGGSMIVAQIPKDGPPPMVI